MPYVPVRLEALKLKDYQDNPTTLEGHLRKKRKELGLTIKEAGRRMGLCVVSVTGIEQGHRSMLPMPTFSKVLAFLGYYPFPSTTIGEQLLMLRRKNGWTLKQAARQLGVDYETWGRWENGAAVPKRRHLPLLDAFLAKCKRCVVSMRP